MKRNEIGMSFHEDAEDEIVRATKGCVGSFRGATTRDGEGTALKFTTSQDRFIDDLT